jgi:hypothetical protein
MDVPQSRRAGKPPVPVLITLPEAASVASLTVDEVLREAVVGRLPVTWVADEPRLDLGDVVTRMRVRTGHRPGRAAALSGASR